MTLHPTADDALDRKIRDAVALFRSRSPLEEATLTLDGTGPNGPLQLAVMQAIGRDDLPRLGRVNVLSGSTFSFLGLVARRLRHPQMPDVDRIERATEDPDPHGPSPDACSVESPSDSAPSCSCIARSAASSADSNSSP